MRRHTIHVTEWDDWQARLEMRCWCVAGDHCHTTTDDHGNPQPIDHCNLVEWFDNADDVGDLIHSRLPGEPPWIVKAEWTDDGPHIVADRHNEPKAGETNG